MEAFTDSESFPSFQWVTKQSSLLRISSTTLFCIAVREGEMLLISKYHTWRCFSYRAIVEFSDSKSISTSFTSSLTTPWVAAIGGVTITSAFGGSVSETDDTYTKLCQSSFKTLFWQCTNVIKCSTSYLSYTTTCYTTCYIEGRWVRSIREFW